MDKELDHLKKMKLLQVEILNDGDVGLGDFDAPYTDVLRVYGGVLYRTMTKTKQVHTVFVPLQEDEK